MSYNVDQKPTAADTKVRALWMLCQYLARKYRARGRAKDERDAATWIRRSVEATYRGYDENRGDDVVNRLDWVPTRNQTAGRTRSSTSPDSFAVASFFHSSINDDDARNLFNLYRDAALKFIVEYECLIEADMQPFLRALEPTIGPYLDTLDLQRRYGIGEEFFFDRAFVANTLRSRGALIGLPPVQVAQRILAGIAGVWIVYRISTPEGEDEQNAEPLTFDKCRINVSLLRIRPFEFLSDIDHLAPRFIYEFTTGDGMQRAEGYLFPVGGKINFLGRLTRGDVGALVSFNWPEDDGWATGQGTPAGEKRGLAFSANARTQRVAFYFLAQFVPGSVVPDETNFDIFVSVLKTAVGQYDIASLQSSIRGSINMACQSIASGQCLGLEVQVPSDDRLEELFSISQRDLVFRQR